MPSATYVIGYDLRKPGQDYTDLFQAIKDCSDGAWWHNLDSTWVIRSALTSAEIRDRLVAHIDENDKLLVVLSANVGAWYGFTQNASDWLQKYL